MFRGFADLGLDADHGSRADHALSVRTALDRGRSPRNSATGFEIIEEGLSGRTTDLDDPTDPRLNGSAYLPSALATHLPLDLVILQLGTNDTKTYFHRSAYDIAVGMSKLLVQVGTSAGGVGTAYPAPRAADVRPLPSAT